YGAFVDTEVGTDLRDRRRLVTVKSDADDVLAGTLSGRAWAW
ncbi:hypothetical protein ACUXNS_002974, partial [Brevibacterium pityocampae]